MARADAGPSIANVAAHGTRPRSATDSVARPPEGLGFPAAGSSGDARPENPSQRLEKVESAPGIASAAMAGADAGPAIAHVAAHGSRPRDATDSVARPPEGQGFPAAGSSGDARPDNPSQRLEKVQSAPGTASAAMAGADAGPSIANVAAHGSRPRAATDCVARPPQGQGFPAAGSSGDARPENPPQRLEKVESAPGIASAAMAGADAGLSIANAAARWTRSLEQAHGVAAQPRARGFRPPPRRRDACPENPAQRLEKVESAPERGSARGRLLASAAVPEPDRAQVRPGDARQRHGLLTARDSRKAAAAKCAGLNR